MQNIHTFSVSAIIRRTKQNKLGEVPVYLRIMVNGKRAEIATKHFIKPSSWNSKTGRVKGKGDVASVVNNTIDLLAIKAKQQYNKLIETGKDIELTSIKNGVTGVEEKQPTLLDVFDKMVDDIKLLIGNEYTESTYKNYLASQRQLHKYVQTQCRLP